MRIPGLLTALLVGLPALCVPPAQADSETLEEIVVTATLRPTTLSQLPQSVTVLDADTLRSAGVQHFEDVLGMIPDLNWAAGTTLPRFFQLRGIGEVEQYQGAPNPSVGFLIDDIDFSGVGMPATLFDTRQIEVLRGPQGTTYGANALAGLISVHTADPGTGLRAAWRGHGRRLRHALGRARHRRWVRRWPGGLAAGRAAVLQRRLSPQRLLRHELDQRSG